MKNVMIYPMFNFPDLSDSYDPDFQLTNRLHLYMILTANKIVRLST